jgi:hypothetical protein
MQIANPKHATDPEKLWADLEERFHNALASQGDETAAALVALCKGKGNETPVKIIPKTRLTELPSRLEIARQQFFLDPSPRNAKTYRHLCWPTPARHQQRGSITWPINSVINQLNNYFSNSACK